MRFFSEVKISLEYELLVCCSRTYLDSTTTEQIKILLQKNINWEYLIDIAIEHGLISLLYWNLNEICPEIIPSNTLTKLQDTFHANVAHTLKLTGELINILHLFEKNNIPAIPYKGPVLAITVYNNLAFRQFGDLDILVRQRDVIKAKKLLISQGYRPLYALSEGQEKIFLSTRYSHPCVRDNDGISVDLHWRITKEHFPFPFDFEELWENRQSVSLMGTTVFSPLLEDLLLLLCVHASKHRWERLNWICDIAELLHHYHEIDWKKLIDKAKLSGSQRMLLLGLNLAHQILDTNLPESLLQKIQKDIIIQSLTKEVYEYLFSDNYLRFKKSWMLEKADFYSSEAAFLIRLRERLKDRLPYLIYLIGNRWLHPPNEKDKAFFSLPNSLSFFYYILRPIRLFQEYIFHKNLLKHFLGL